MYLERKSLRISYYNFSITNKVKFKPLYLTQIAAKWAVIGVFVGFEFFRVLVCVLQIFFF